MGLARWLNAAWMWKCRPELRAFRRATRDVERTQWNVLRGMLDANRDTWFGRRYDFAAIGDVRTFQQRVPLSVYEDYRGPIERIGAGEQGVLTREPVRLLEPTGGSSGGEKLIPYTASLRRQFQRGVAAWMGDLLGERPAIRHGRAYWSISPALGPRRYSAGGLPIGFDDDAAYLGSLERWMLAKLLVMPSAAARIADMQMFRYATLLRLLAAGDLTLLSIWSPTLLTGLLASVEAWHEPIARDLRHGTITPPGQRTALPPELAGHIAVRGSHASRRAEELEAIFRGTGSLSEKLAKIWPRLALISCWTDAAAGLAIADLRRLFPAIEIQSKGLLATEGFVSLPLCGEAAPALALRSHFFEFVESEASAEAGTASGVASPPRLAHQLEPGGVYRVVLTTGGGLYRYQLHDEVRVVGHLNECPLLKFLGKADHTSDLVGEKLGEPHVRAVLQRAFESQRARPRFAMLVPAGGPASACYRLYLQMAADEVIDLARLQHDVEQGLAANPQYRYALALGQLASLEIRRLDPHGEAAWTLYSDERAAAGQRAGDVKPLALDAGRHWPAVFRRLERPASASSGGIPAAR
jgi:hypothetical protein